MIFTYYLHTSSIGSNKNGLYGVHVQPSKSMETVLDILNCDTLPSRNNSNLVQGALLTICLGGVLSAS